MASERLTNLVLIIGVANILSLALMVVLTFYNAYCYRVLRQLAVLLVLNDVRDAEERPVDRSTSKRGRHVAEETRTTRYDSHHPPDAGGVEWTGPVVPYVPKDR
jgi:hypothetical protein